MTRALRTRVGFRNRTTRHTRERQRKWRDQVKAHERELRENRCPAGLLNVLAGAYFGNYVDVQGNTSMDRLRNLIGDESLVQLARQGLRHSIERDDLPTDAEIIRLRSRKQTHYLALPVLAGLEEAARDGTERALSLDDRQMRLALAVHYTVAEPVAAPGSPSWFPPLLMSPSAGRLRGSGSGRSIRNSGRYGCFRQAVRVGVLGGPRERRPTGDPSSVAEVPRTLHGPPVDCVELPARRGSTPPANGLRYWSLSKRSSLAGA